MNNYFFSLSQTAWKEFTGEVGVCVTFRCHASFFEDIIKNY